MTILQTNAEARGSNPGAAKILIVLVLGPLLLGGIWSLLGPRSHLVGTWQGTGVASSDAFRFDADGSFWYNSSSGLLSVRLVGSYRIVSASKDSFRIRIKTELGESDEREYRFETPDRLVSLDPENPEDQALFTRAGNWVLTLRPSASSSTYDGAKPHLGCWQRQDARAPGLELREDGTLLRYRGDEVTSVSYSVDYSNVPFQLDITDAEGQVDREIFDFVTGEALRISQTHLADGARPDEMNQFQVYVPCIQSESQGAS